MNKHFLTLAVAGALGFGFAGTAQASAIYLIDDFNHAAGDPFSVTLNKVGASLPTPFTQGPVSYLIGTPAYSISRSILFTMTADGSNAPKQDSKLTVGPGTLNISNGSLANSSLDLSYSIGSLAAPILAGGLGHTSSKFTVNFSDGTGNAGANISPTTIRAYLDNTSLGSVALNQVYDENTAPGQITFTLVNGLIDGSDTLRFSFSGPTGYDLTISSISLMVGAAAADAVPEPGMIGLFGLGIVGLAFARRRQR